MDIDKDIIKIAIGFKDLEDNGIDFTKCQRCGRTIEHITLPDGGINLYGIDAHIDEFHKDEFDKYKKDRQHKSMMDE